MKALTVQQPWAWAIIHGGKDVENRSQMWQHIVGQTLAIHAGVRVSDRGMDSELMGQAFTDHPWPEDVDPFVLGALIGVVDVVDAHEAFPEVESAPGSGLFSAACCESPWAEQSYVEHGGRTRTRLVHYVLENPRELLVPYRCRGKLGLWAPPDDALGLLLTA